MKLKTFDMPRIYEWSEIKDEFTDSLLVGNGGSMALSNNFVYKSLYEKATEKENLDQATQQVFSKFYKDSHDFERVLYRLWQANYINDLFSVSDEEKQKIKDGYNLIQKALLKAVKDIHPDHRELKGQLFLVGKYLSHFKTVFSLNYDLIMYWSMLEYNDQYKNVLKDGFITSDLLIYNSKVFAKNRIEILKKPYTGNNSATLVFYPHGNLILHRTKSREGKIQGHKASYTSILETIADFWEENNSLPLFVSEGTYQEKLEVISSSNYLSYVIHEELPNGGDSLVIYGWGIGKQDTHILEQIARGTYQQIAVSVYKGNKEDEQINREVEEIVQRIISTAKNIDEDNIKFFDAQSAGCWNN